MEKKRYLILGSIVGETFNLYFSNFMLFCLPYVIVMVPVSQIQAAVTASYGTAGLPVFLSLLSSVISLIISFSLSYYLTVIVLKRYKDESVDVKESFISIFPRVLIYALMNFLIIMGITLWSLLLIIPGIIYFAATSVADIIMVREGLGIRASLKRSRLLTKKRRFTIVCSFAILFLIMIILFLINSRLLGFTLQGGLTQFAETDAYSGNTVLNIVYAIVSNCLMPLFAVMSVVIYMNLLKEKEGFETEQLADSFLEDKND
jgi:hypothetical protein